MISKAQIVATITELLPGATLKELVDHQMDVVRFNFAWADLDKRASQIGLIRKFEKESGRPVLIIIDLPGSRIQETTGHTYTVDTASSVTADDERFIQFAAAHGVDYLAVSFVGEPQDIEARRSFVRHYGGTQKIIAKIERSRALENLDAIIAVSDAIMIARGDLGKEVPLERIPFIQKEIIQKCKTMGKPVIVATQMMVSMVENVEPTRAEVAHFF